MYTAQNITDADIKAIKFAANLADDHSTVYECRRALGETLFDDIGRVQAIRESRARCAELLNARKAKP